MTAEGGAAGDFWVVRFPISGCDTHLNRDRHHYAGTFGWRRYSPQSSSAPLLVPNSIKRRNAKTQPKTPIIALPNHLAEWWTRLREVLKMGRLWTYSKWLFPSNQGAGHPSALSGERHRSGSREANSECSITWAPHTSRISTHILGFPRTHRAFIKKSDNYIRDPYRLRPILSCCSVFAASVAIVAMLLQ